MNISSLSMTDGAYGERARRAPRRCRMLAAVVGPLVIFLAIAGLVASPASAATVWAAGYPGSASSPWAYAQYVSLDSRIQVQDRIIYESNAYSNYDQYVCVTPRVYRAAPTARGWTLLAQSQTCGWIPAAWSSITGTGVTFTGLFAGWFYKTDVSVTWQLSNGAVIGTAVYDYNQLGDHQCVSAYPYCSTSWSAALGAYVLFI